jgi:hypothetical protein
VGAANESIRVAVQDVASEMSRIDARESDVLDIVFEGFVVGVVPLQKPCQSLLCMRKIAFAIKF